MPRFLPSLTAALAWGAMFPIVGPALGRLDAFHITTVRYLAASSIFLGLLAAVEGRKALSTDGRTRELWALGTLGFAGFNLLTFVALGHIQPQDAALIVATAPVVTVLVLWALGAGRPRGAQLALTALAFVGVAVVISRGDPARLGSSSAGWELLVLGGVLGWIGYTLAAARRFPGFSPLRYTAITSALGTLSLVGITAIAVLTGAIGSPAPGDYAAEWWRLLYTIGPGAVIAVLAWNDGVRRIGPANGSLFINLVPVVTFAITIGQGYRPGVAELAGAALTVGALISANLVARSREAKPQASARPPRAAWAATRSANPLKSRA
jgi:drug/metabolite transporter (DMT)-like permease